MKKIVGYLLLISLSLSMGSFSYGAIVLPVKNKTAEPDPSIINAAKAEFRSLSKNERKERIRNVKLEIKHLKLEKKAGRTAKVDEVVLIILAILLPPLAVYLHQGEVNGKFWLSILLWILGLLPGIIYALLVVTDSI